MKIGIIVAMDKEMNLLLPHVADVSTVTANGFEFHTGLMAGHKVVVCKCGIGKVNAAVGTLTLIDTFQPDMVVNTGVAGGTGAGAPPVIPNVSSARCRLMRVLPLAPARVCLPRATYLWMTLPTCAVFSSFIPMPWRWIWSRLR